MPSTPRMISIERKASQVGEPLTQAEVSEWNEELLKPTSTEMYSLGRKTLPYARNYTQPDAWVTLDWKNSPLDYSAAIRYLDSTQYRPAMKERNHG